MEFKLTSKYQHSKRLPNGTRRSMLLYFLNGIFIFKQKMPFDETGEYGCGKWHYSDQYLLNGKLYQTRFDEKKSRNVSYPVSQKTLIQFNIPKDLKISKI